MKKFLPLIAVLTFIFSLTIIATTEAGGADRYMHKSFYADAYAKYLVVSTEPVGNGGGGGLIGTPIPYPCVHTSVNVSANKTVHKHGKEGPWKDAGVSVHIREEDYCSNEVIMSISGYFPVENGDLSISLKKGLEVSEEIMAYDEMTNQYVLVDVNVIWYPDGNISRGNHHYSSEKDKGHSNYSSVGADVEGTVTVLEYGLGFKLDHGFIQKSNSGGKHH